MGGGGGSLDGGWKLSFVRGKKEAFLPRDAEREADDMGHGARSYLPIKLRLIPPALMLIWWPRWVIPASHIISQRVVRRLGGNHVALLINAPLLHWGQG